MVGAFYQQIDIALAVAGMHTLYNQLHLPRNLCYSFVITEHRRK